VEYGNSLLMPWLLMETGLSEDVAIIPIFLNVFTPPLMKHSWAYALGEACRVAAVGVSDEMRIAVLRVDYRIGLLIGVRRKLVIHLLIRFCSR